MSRESCRAKAERELHGLQATFERRLVEALRRCAAGHWGLFGHNDEVLRRAFGSNPRYVSNDAEELLALGEKIEEIRMELGYVDRYVPYEHFLAFREERGSNPLGEPKLAKKVLDEMERVANEGPVTQ